MTHLPGQGGDDEDEQAMAPPGELLTSFFVLPPSSFYQSEQLRMGSQEGEGVCQNRAS